MSRKENLEAVVIAWLRELVPGYPASSDTPKTLPDRFILVERTGGAREAMLGDNAEILIEVYDKESRYDCSEIANFIGDHIIELTQDYENVTHASINSIISLDDTQKQYHRYQIYCDIFHSRVGIDSAPTPPTPPAPTTTGIALLFNGRPATAWTVQSLNSGRTFSVLRSPEDSRSEIHCQLSEQSEKFTIEIVQEAGTPDTGSLKITQTTASSPKQAITATVTCGTGSATLTINPK